LIGGKLFGPHFYNGTLTGRRYLDFLLDDLQLLLDDLPLDIRRNMYYQQDNDKIIIITIIYPPINIQDLKNKITQTCYLLNEY
jgi:hypothetical protein